MKKKSILFTAILAILLFASCNNEEILPEMNPTLSLTLSMPEDNPTTRVDLNEEPNKLISLKWVIGDKVKLVFIQGSLKEIVEAEAISTSASRRSADFNVPIPAGMQVGLFDLYGVYGGGGIDITSGPNPLAVFPTLPNIATTLNGAESTSVQNRKDVMLYFALQGINTNNPPASVTLIHFGSLFSVVFDDPNGDTPQFLLDAGITESRLVGVHNTGGNVNWAYNSGTGGKSFDLVTGQFQNTTSGGNYISFKPSFTSTINSRLTLWGWYPIIGIQLPDLQYQLYSGTTLRYATSNFKLARTPVAGKSYIFYVGTKGAGGTPQLPIFELFFTNDQFQYSPNNTM